MPAKNGGEAGSADVKSSPAPAPTPVDKAVAMNFAEADAATATSRLNLAMSYRKALMALGFRDCDQVAALLAASHEA